MKFSCAVLVVAAGFLVGNTFAAKAASKQPTKTRGFLDFFGLGSNSEPEEEKPPNLPPYLYTHPGPGLQPCIMPISTTTTPLPLVGPLCPLYPPQPGGQPLPPTGALIMPPSPSITGGTGVGIGGNVNIPPHERPGEGITFGLGPEPYPRPGGSITGGTGIGVGGNVNVPAERPFGGVEVGLRPFVPSRPEPTLTGGPGIGVGIPPERPSGIPVGLGPFQPPRPVPVNLIGGSGIGIGGNVIGPPPIGGIAVQPCPIPIPPSEIYGGTGLGIGGNVNVPPERPFERPHEGILVEPGPGPYPPRPGQEITGGTGIGVGGNVNIPYPPERPNGFLVGGPEPYPPRPGQQITGGTGIGVGGNVNVPPERPLGGIEIGPGPYPLGPGQEITGGTGIGVGGNVNVPPERPSPGFLVGPGPEPYPPRPGQEITGGTGIGVGGNVNLPEPYYPLPSEPRPISSHPPPPPFIRNPVVCCVGGPFPYVPQGFSYASPHLIPPQEECPRVPNPDVPPCSTMEMLDRLQLRTMYGYILKSGLEQLFQMTSNYTLFVPADPAFYTLPEWFLASLDTDIKLLRAFILNHMIKVDTPLHEFGNEFLILNARPGGNRLRSNVYFPELPYRTYTFDGSQVLLGDILTRNGRLNIVNKVIVPNPPRNAAQYLQEVPEFSKFMSAVVAANMVDLLQGPDPMTLFIPFNEAFRDFDFQVLQKNATALRNFINYHIVPGTFYSNGLLNGQHLATHFDKEIRVSVTSDGFTKSLTAVNNFNTVLKADVPLLNGVAHIISGVLSNVPDFYFYQEMSEFHTLNFGSLKRNSVVDDNHLHQDQGKSNSNST